MTSTKHKPYQQKIYLGVRPTPAGVQYAEQQARLIGAELNLNRFDWSNWLNQSDQIGTTSEWVTRFEEDYWNRHKRTKSSENTWKVYAQVFKKLPDEVLTLELLLDCVKSTTPDSRSRQKTCIILPQLARLAKLPADSIHRRFLETTHPIPLPPEVCRLMERSLSGETQFQTWVGVGFMG